MPTNEKIVIRPARADDRVEWLRLRTALWPECALAEHDAEMNDSFESAAIAVFVAERPEGGLCGFLEAAIRPCDFDGILAHIGYVEGWYVDPDVRRRGVGRAIMRAAENWARRQGCREIHSDAEVSNTLSHTAHRALGYKEAARLVHFRMRLE